MRRVEGLFDEPYAERHQPGDYEIADRGAGLRIAFVLPAPEGFVAVPIGGQPNAWQYDGNLDCPTLSPSIWVNKPSGWHGHVKAGELVGC